MKLSAFKYKWTVGSSKGTIKAIDNNHIIGQHSNLRHYTYCCDNGYSTCTKLKSKGYSVTLKG